MLPNIGLGELTVIVLVALLVFGPKRLPEMMRSAGRALGRFQRESQSALAELRNATDFKADLGSPPTLGAFDAPDVAPAGVAAVAPAEVAVVPPEAPAARPVKAPRSPARKPAARTAAKSRKPATKSNPTTKSKPAATEPFEDT